MFYSNQIKTAQITQWTQQLAILLNAHLPLMQALDLLLHAQTHQQLHQLTYIIHQDIMQGNPLSTALRRYPHLFDKTYCQLIYSAEQSGALSTILQKIAEQRSLRQQIQQQLIKAFIYPSMVLCVGMGVFILLLAWVVPQLAGVFKQFSQELPWFTQLILDSATLVRRNGGYFFWGTLLSIILLYVLCTKVTRLGLLFARWSWHSPGVGRLLQQAGCVLFSRTLSLLLSSGIPIATSLVIVLPVIDNAYAQQQLRTAALLISQGHSFSYAVQQTHLFPALALQMWKLGECTGKLTDLLHDCAIYYQQQLDIFIQQLTQFIEPVLLIVLGLLIGGVVIAMYLPLFRIGLVVGG